MRNKIATVIFLCLVYFLKGNAQNRVAYRDSVMVFQLLSKDTSLTIPQQKIVNTYNADSQLTEQRIYIWKIKTNSWQQQKRFTALHFAKEILVECYQNEGSAQEIPAGRIILSLDDKGYVSGATKYEKDRYAPRYQRRQQIDFLYTHDTLSSAVTYVQGTTFHKQSKLDVSFEKKSPGIRIQQFDESGKVVNNQFRLFYFLNGQLTAIKYSNADKGPVRIDSLYYIHDTLVKKETYVISGEKNDKMRLEASADYIYQSGSVKITKIFLTTDGKSIGDARNSLTRFSSFRLWAKSEREWHIFIEHLLP